MSKLAGTEHVEFFTSKDPMYGGAIGFFNIKNIEPGKVAEMLLARNIHAVAIVWERFSGIRVTPNVYTLTSDLDRFVDAVQDIAATEN